MKRREFLLASGGLFGTLLPGIGRASPCPPPQLTLTGGDQVSTSCVSATAEADFQSRIAGSGVVWYHDFRSDNEVNAFRWTGGYANGNDPLAVGNPIAPLCHRITTDGVTGGCLEIVRPVGTNDGSDWWRPFMPIAGGTTTGNGRGAGQNDPAANGTLPLRSWTATDGGDQMSGLSTAGTYYGSSQGGNGPWPAYVAPGYWLQMRIKMDPRRLLNSEDTGKLMILGRSDRSNVDQKIVVYSGHNVGGKNYFGMYSQAYSNAPLYDHPPGASVQGNQPGTVYGGVGDGLCVFNTGDPRIANCWYWPNPAKWVTVMWHVVPGTSGGSNTLIEVYVAEPPATTFTRIWYQPHANLNYDPDHPQGHNAMHLSCYLNGVMSQSEFWHRYCQIIFSLNSIPCPNDPVQRGEA